MENMDSIWGFLGIIVIVCGFYAIYSLIKMKRTGEIDATLLLGKDYAYKTCKDKEGFSRKVTPALLILGITAILYGALDIIHCYFYPMLIVDSVGMAVFFVVLVWFAVYTTKLKKEYF